MFRNVFHVFHRGGLWLLKQEGFAKILDSTFAKGQAVAHARAYAMERRPSRLVVHELDGTIETESTYGSGPDSSPV